MSAPGTLSQKRRQWTSELGSLCSAQEQVATLSEDGGSDDWKAFGRGGDPEQRQGGAGPSEQSPAASVEAPGEGPRERADPGRPHAAAFRPQRDMSAGNFLEFERLRRT